MQYDDQLGSNVLNQIRSLPFWMDFENRVAVAIVGSVGAGMGDVHSDLDAYLLVPEIDSLPLYENYQKGYAEGSIDVLTTKSLFHEYGHLDRRVVFRIGLCSPFFCHGRAHRGADNAAVFSPASPEPDSLFFSY